MRLPDFLFSPLTAAWLLALLLAIFWRRLPRGLRWSGIGLEVLLLLLIAPVGANLLVAMVESRVPASADCKLPGPDTIMVLSGGTDRRPQSPQDFSALSEASLHRLFAGVALWRRLPDAHLVIAGGGARVPESVLMADLAVQMGVPAGAIRTEQRSHTTWENAMNVAALTPAVPARIWLVTSALHTPRAISAFHAWNFKPCAWPTDSAYVPFSVSVGYFMPQASSLDKVDRAIHELIGGVVYHGLEWKRLRDVQQGAQLNELGAKGQGNDSVHGKPVEQ